jgi:hypothetical protein
LVGRYVAGAPSKTEGGGRRLPSRDQMETVKVALELLLLLLALPWLLYRLVTNPADLVRKIGHHHEA